MLLEMRLLWDMKQTRLLQDKAADTLILKPCRRMIALLNMAIMDKTAMIRTAELIIFSRLLLLLSKNFSLFWILKQSISQEDELFY